MKKAFFLFLFTPSLIMAQTSETIVSDRPGQANAAYTVGKGVLQGQHGINFIEVASTIKTLAFSNTFRYGVLDKLEISSTLIYQNGDLRDGLRFTNVGGRYSLLENEGWIPAIAVQGQLLLPWQSKEFKRDQLGTLWNINTNNSLGESFSLSTNWGVAFEGNDNIDPSWFYVWNLGYSINDQWGTFAEIYGNLNDFNSNFDTGLSYLINNNLQLDAGLGVDLSNAGDYWFGDIGISWRIP